MAPVTTTVTLQASGTASVTPHSLWASHAGSILTAFLLPFGSFLAFSRRRFKGNGSPLRLLGLIVLLLASTGAIVGCSSYMAPAASTPPPTTPTAPAGVQMVTVTATSGAITQQTTIALNVQ